jgi:hypothetical protein
LLIDDSSIHFILAQRISQPWQRRLER